MTPTAPGRHCSACQLTVVDFSRMSDAEVVAFLARAPATTCGRFAGPQLDRQLFGAAPPPPRWRTWLTAATALLASLLTTVAARAQVPAAVPGAQPQPNRPTATPPPTSSITLRGRVFDQVTQEPVPFAALSLNGLGINTLSKEDGSFELVVPAAQLAAHPTDTLVVQLLGFHRHASFLDLRSAAAGNLLIDRQIGLSRQDLFITGIIVVTPSPDRSAGSKHKLRNRRR